MLSFTLCCVQPGSRPERAPDISFTPVRSSVGQNKAACVPHVFGQRTLTDNVSSRSGSSLCVRRQLKVVSTLCHVPLVCTDRCYNTTLVSLPSLILIVPDDPLLHRHTLRPMHVNEYIASTQPSGCRLPGPFPRAHTIRNM